MKSLLKKNQVIIYVIALMLMTAGYLNYTTKNEDETVQTISQMEFGDDTQIADIGDATLVSSGDVVESNDLNTDTTSNQNIVEDENNDVDNNMNSENVIETGATDSDNANDLSSNITNAQESVQTSSTNGNSNDYFARSKLDRESMYSQMVETYENVLNSSNALETQRQSATEEISKINGIKNSIMICENLIQTKGFENCVIFVNGDSINIIVRDDELKTEEVAQIQNIISREMSAEIENVHISTK